MLVLFQPFKLQVQRKRATLHII